MNCKPGDLAVVVRAPVTPEMIGRFVIVERTAIDGEIYHIDTNGTHHRSVIGSDACWIVRAAVAGGSLPMRSMAGGLYQHPIRPMLDKFLRPIRPNEGEDESLSWAKPRVEELA